MMSAEMLQVQRSTFICCWKQLGTQVKRQLHFQEVFIRFRELSRQRGIVPDEFHFESWTKRSCALCKGFLSCINEQNVRTYMAQLERFDTPWLAVSWRGIPKVNFCVACTTRTAFELPSPRNVARPFVQHLE